MVLPLATRSIALGLLSLLSLLASVSSASAQTARNFYDWIGVSPIVVAVESHGSNGRLTEVTILETLRGELPQGQRIKVDVVPSNHERDRDLHPRPLRLDGGISYLLLLKPHPSTKRRYRSSYVLVRGIRGARELPAEGGEAVLRAMRKFVEIQELHDDRQVWIAMAELLGDSDPVMVQTALEQFLRFRRGETELLPDLLRLLNHPGTELRERAARLVGQIVSRERVGPVTDTGRLRLELIGRARRDRDVSVRVAATEALGTLAGPRVDEALELIARDDPDQMVRLAAERLIHDRNQSTSGSN